MSHELQTEMTEHSLTGKWGGDHRGQVVQVTSNKALEVCENVDEALQQEGYIDLTMEEAARLCNDLQAFIYDEAKRRQALLKKKINELKIKERTVFAEVIELPRELMEGPKTCVEMIGKYCPKVEE